MAAVNSISKTLKWVVGILLFVAITPVIQEFVISVAREYGVFEKPTDRVESIFSAVRNHPWYPFVLTGAVGIFVGVCFDAVARRLDHRQLIKIAQRHPLRVKPVQRSPQDAPEPSDEFQLNLNDLFVLLDKHFAYPHFVDSLMIYLRDGRMTAFGYPMLGSWETSPNHGLGPQEQIKAKYWENADIGWTSMNWSDRTYHQKGGIAYAKLFFARSEVMSAFFGHENNWPK